MDWYYGISTNLQKGLRVESYTNVGPLRHPGMQWGTLHVGCRGEWLQPNHLAGKWGLHGLDGKSEHRINLIYMIYIYIYTNILFWYIHIYIYKEYITYIYILRAQTVFLLSTICKRESLQQYFFGSEVSWILQVAQFSRPPLAMDARIMALCLFRTHSMWHHMGIFLIGYLIHLWPPWKMQAHFPLELVVNLHLFVNLWAKNGKKLENRWETIEKRSLLDCEVQKIKENKG